jgi:hypothetical protein
MYLVPLALVDIWSFLLWLVFEKTRTPTPRVFSACIANKGLTAFCGVCIANKGVSRNQQFRIEIQVGAQKQKTRAGQRG